MTKRDWLDVFLTVWLVIVALWILAFLFPGPPDLVCHICVP